MFYIRSLTILLLCLTFGKVSSLAIAQDTAPAGKIFNAEEFELDNGMRVVVIPNHRVPVVTHMVWYGVGAADEARGQSGIAHFLEHLMFKGSDGLQPGEFSKIVKKLGGQDNAFTSQDYTAYFQSISKEHLETVIKMEAGRMRGMNPPLKDVLSERKVILEERSQRTDNNPQARFSEHLHTTLYVNHPYGTPIIGWRHEMEILDWDGVKSFYDLYYAPNNAILVVAGDVDSAEVLALAQKYYGSLPQRVVPERVRTAPPPLSSTPVLTMRDPNVKQAQYQLLFRTPSCRQNRQECLAFTVLENIMGSGATSRLYDSLVVQQKIASNAGFSYSSSRWDDVTTYLYATPAAGQEPKDVEHALDEELRRLIKDGVTQKEVADAISRIQASSIYARDSVAGPAMIIGGAMITGSTLEDIEYEARDIAKVTAGQVQDIAQKYLNPDSADILSVRGYLLPASAVKTSENREVEQ